MDHATDSATAAGFALSSRARRATSQPISYLMAQAVDNPHLISLAAGLVDNDTLPCAEARELLEAILADPRRGRAALQYGTTHGLLELREALLEHLCRLDGATPAELGLSAEDVIVTTGSQQLLALLTDVLVDPGDIVITAWPSYFVYAGVLQAAGAQVRCVDVDEDGIRPGSLDALLGELEGQGLLGRVKIVYVVTDHDNPAGITLAAHRRPAVLEVVRRWSRERRILLLEDAAYRELTFDGPPLASIKRHDAGNERVALLQTFSKPFAPGLKTGYGLLPRGLMDAVVLQKGNQDFGSANLCQHLLLAALRTGAYDRHLAVLRAQYARKCAAMLEAMDEHLGGFAPGEVHWTRPRGGLYVYLTLPETFDTGREGPLFPRALAEGVLYVPGEYCYGPDPTRRPPRNTMRLSFGVAGVEAIRGGIERLARAIRAAAGA